ncbi:hypothetical protein F5X68DRAFT_198887 [Plectosphaerella plurivora]|uniref:Uncharacterized protein n=1 Tax=Plectosphaerella plurivora TaxID=936078 RepID=A0A9P9AHT1_9PEZI|nr:hypothetical protein F5X68DRAFT_198887 [Plectosphaerella plurivora]
MGEMIQTTAPSDERTKRASDELIWQDLNRRAIDQPMLKAMTIERLPNLVTNVYDAMDEVLVVSGLAGNKGISGLPPLMQDAMTCVPKIAEMARQAHDGQPLRIGAYALMSLAIALRSFAATFRVFESVGAVLGPSGTKPTSNELCLAVWHDKDGRKVQEGVLLAHDVWRIGYKQVEATYGSSTWKDGGAWIRRMAKGELDL